MCSRKRVDAMEQEQRRRPEREYRNNSAHLEKQTFGLDWEDEDRGRGFTRFSGRSGSCKPEKVPELYSIHKAKVQSVQPFGLFVRLEGFEKHGLVHLSQLSKHEVANRDDSDDVKVQAISSVAAKGEQVWVKVVSLKEEESGNVKIGCSLKYVSQSTGQDLDPNNIQSEQKRSGPNRLDPRKVTLGAVYNVVCSRCGGHGHLKAECYAIGDKSYELLPETDELVQDLLDDRSGSTEMGQYLVDDKKRSDNLKSSRRDHKQEQTSGLPERVTTVEEALAVIANHKKDKKERREKRKRRSVDDDRKLARELKKHDRKEKKVKGKTEDNTICGREKDRRKK